LTRGLPLPVANKRALLFTLSFLSDSVPGSLKITLCRRRHPEHTEGSEIKIGHPSLVPQLEECYKPSNQGTKTLSN
jgi:hypothetical protein